MVIRLPFSFGISFSKYIFFKYFVIGWYHSIPIVKIVVLGEWSSTPLASSWWFIYGKWFGKKLIHLSL